MNLQIVAAMIFLPVLAGCEGSSADDTAPMKTATYYTQHLDEAKSVANRCKLMSDQKLRTLNAGDFQEWQISNEGVNCQTAQSVAEAALVRELVLRQSRPSVPVATPKSSPPPSSAVPAMRDRTDNQKLSAAQTLAPV
ncbi:MULTISPECIES: hypothetical protein [unclassified Duganella]|jgi:hypothetical protein|uniref:hypothetical protein n=1 Tax=unclassified Duganella TaxID=2636909 RepID=UPI0008922E13|nr:MULTISPECIES: hypothetical protein [unclassified Duganella]SDG79993.1 hypothetical protein SAMN05216320_107112 [Duganella sp. OV458]SDK07144.1 hypothetical protein SAMN05428973_108112 [Duganella sp. OV510]